MPLMKRRIIRSFFIGFLLLFVGGRQRCSEMTKKRKVLTLKEGKCVRYF